MSGESRSDATAAAPWARAAHAPARGEQRPEIEGLRALAVLLVVLFHVRLPGAAGGFIGVDVFFVISGFLITRNLFDEAQRTQRVELAAFWARRARRLLPAASLVFAATALGALAWLSPLQWKTFAGDLLASATYLSNFAFLRRANGYFDTEVTSSPLLHTWSLGVEEQFYLFWPLLALAAARFAARRGGELRRVVGWGLVAITAASLLLSLAQTSLAPAWAYFGAPARAWQFGFGALLSIAPSERPSARARALLGAGGAALLLAAMYAIDEQTPYPGYAALLPTCGALALIAAGAQSLTGRWLSLPPLRALGRCSYSLYLWHWPLIVFADLATSLGLAGRIAAAALATALAFVSQRFVEEPARFHPFVQPVRRSLALAGGLTLMTAALAGIVLGVESAAHRDPELAALWRARDDRAGDEAGNECAMLDPAQLAARCRFGAAHGVPVLLLGDSHAQHWKPALEPAAQQLGWTITYAGRGGCPSVPVRVAKHFASRPTHACVSWQDNLPRLLGALKPRWVIVANSNAYLGRIVSADGSALDLAEQAALWRAGAERLARELAGRGTRLLWLLDTPKLPADPLDCLARGLGIAACTTSRSAATATISVLRAQELAALAANRDVAGFDPLPLLCDRSSCPLELGGRLVYRDSSHFAASFARTLAPALTSFLRGAVASATPPLSARLEATVR